VEGAAVGEKCASSAREVHSQRQSLAAQCEPRLQAALCAVLFAVCAVCIVPQTVVGAQ